MTHLIDLSNLSPVALYLANLLWIATLLSAAAIAAAWIMPRRALAAQCHVLTAGLVLLLLAPSGAEIARRWLGAPQSQAVPQSIPRQFGAKDITPLQHSGAEVAPSQGHQPVAAQPPSRQIDALENKSTRFPWTAGIILIWIGGSAAVVARGMIRLRRARRATRSHVTAHPRMVTAVTDAAAALTLDSSPDVVATTSRVSPHAIGVRNPIVVFPESAIALSDDQLRAIALHEVAHLKYHHHLTLPVQFAARALFYWHPLVRSLLRRLDAAQERVCDASAVNAQGDGTTLAEAIVEMAERIMRNETPGLAMIRRRSDLERRIAALVQPKGVLMQTTTSRRAFAALVAVAALGGCGAVLSAARNPTESHIEYPHQIVVREDAPQPRSPGEVPIEPPRIVQGNGDTPPSIIYGKSRASSTFIDGVAVDEGLEWKGVKAYLGLMCDVVVVDIETDKPIWKVSSSAFYDTLTFRNVADTPGEQKWAVRLRSSGANDVQTDAYFDLRTGAPIRLPEQEDRPRGTPGTPLRVWSGSKAVNNDPVRELVTGAAAWKRLRRTLFGDMPDADAPGIDDIDFDRNVLLVLSSGRSPNCRGIGGASVYYQEHQILLRLQYFTYQTAAIIQTGEGLPDTDSIEFPAVDESLVERPYGLFLFPRAGYRRLVVERNMQRYIAGPAIWKTANEFDIRSPRTAR